MDTSSILLTPFGEIKLGPKFEAVFCAEGLKKNKSSEAYKAAINQSKLTYEAFCLMQEACYMAGVEMQTVTP